MLQQTEMWQKLIKADTHYELRQVMNKITKGKRKLNF